MAHRKLLRHAVEFDLLSSSAAPRDFESSKKHAAEHKFSPSFSFRYSARLTPSSFLTLSSHTASTWLHGVRGMVGGDVGLCVAVA